MGKRAAEHRDSDAALSLIGDRLLGAVQISGLKRGVGHSTERTPQCDLGNDVALSDVTAFVRVCQSSEFGSKRFWQRERDDLTSGLAVERERAALALLVGRREP